MSRPANPPRPPAYPYDLPAPNDGLVARGGLGLLTLPDGTTEAFDGWVDARAVEAALDADRGVRRAAAACLAAHGKKHEARALEALAAEVGRVFDGEVLLAIVDRFAGLTPAVARYVASKAAVAAVEEQERRP